MQLLNQNFSVTALENMVHKNNISASKKYQVAGIDEKGEQFLLVGEDRSFIWQPIHLTRFNEFGVLETLLPTKPELPTQPEPQPEKIVKGKR